MILLRCSDRVCRLFNISNCGQMCDSRSWRRCCFWLPQCRCYHSSSVSLCSLWLVAAQRCPSLTPSTAGKPSETWIFREPPVMSCFCFQTGTTEWKTKERNNNNKYISNSSDASLIHCSERWKQLLRLIETIQSAQIGSTQWIPRNNSTFATKPFQKHCCLCKIYCRLWKTRLQVFYVNIKSAFPEEVNK